MSQPSAFVAQSEAPEWLAEPTEDVRAAVVALAGLPAMTPHMLRQMVSAAPIETVWGLVRANQAVPGIDNPPARRRDWAERAKRTEPRSLLQSHLEVGIEVRLWGEASYPRALAHDPQAPAALFSRGRLEVLDRPRVALVGTRAATPRGREVAAELGAGLARAGVVVVSGLALGIDGAAHSGVLDASSGPDNQGIDAWAPPAAVVAGGVDVVYPRPNAGLWNRIAHQGVIVSESPRGFPHQAWRFPWRNRVIAALAQVVVVVESHQGGGSFYTVESAMRRGRPVLAVPGSIRSPASLGTNRLLRDGAIPALDVEDILVALDRSRTQAITPRKTRRAGQARSKPTGGWAGDEGGRCGDRPTAGAKTALSVTAPLSVRGPMPPGSSLSAHTLEHSRDGQVQEPSEGDEPLGATEKAVLESLDWEPIGLAVVIDRTSMSLGRVAFALELLESKGLARCRGSWWERS